VSLALSTSGFSFFNTDVAACFGVSSPQYETAKHTPQREVFTFGGPSFVAFLKYDSREHSFILL